MKNFNKHTYISTNKQTVQLQEEYSVTKGMFGFVVFWGMVAAAVIGEVNLYTDLSQRAGEYWALTICGLVLAGAYVPFKKAAEALCIFSEQSHIQ